jgi:hypothetical protein
MDLQTACFNSWTTHQERHAHVKLEGETFALDQAKLTQMIAVIGGVENVRVVELAELLEFLINALYCDIHTLQRLQSLRHENVGEFSVDRFHLFGHTQNPLLIGIWSEIV